MSFKIQPAIISLPTFRYSSHETALSYERSDGRSVDLTILHEEPGWPAELLLTIKRSRNLPDVRIIQQMELSKAEIRYLRDLLNRPEVTELLDEEDE